MTDPHGPIEITDPDDARLDDFRDLTTADRRPDNLVFPFYVIPAEDE